MPANAILIGGTLALELVKFVRSTKNLANYTDEQVLEMWAATNKEAKAALANWKTEMDKAEARANKTK